MFKLVLLVVVAIVVVAWLRGMRRVPPREADPAAPPMPPERRVAGEEMVSCEQCGVHLPRSEAVTGRLGHYCGEVHRLAHEQEDPPA